MVRLAEQIGTDESTDFLRALSDEQMREYHRNGFHIARGLFTQAKIDEIRQAFMEANKNGPVEGLSDIKGNYSGSEFTSSDPLKFYPRMMHPHRHPELSVGELSMRYMFDPCLRPIMHDLLADDPVACQTMFYFKPPGARGQSLHQDNYYLRVKPLTCMAAWVAIDDADEENGGMVVVPGSHRLDIACPGKADASIFFSADCVPVPEGMHETPTHLKAGDVLFFNGSLIHGSYPNRSSDRFRRAFICHYLPKGSVELASWYSNPISFDHEHLSYPQATGGGPCGAPQIISEPH